MSVMIKGLSMELSAAVHAAALTDDTAFDALGSEWDQLLDESDQCVFFLRWSWTRLWWRAYAPPNSHLFIIVCRDEHDRLIGLAPFYLRQRRTVGIPHIREVLFLGTGIYTQISEYMDIAARRGYEQVVAEAVASLLLDSRDWDRLCLNEIPASSTVLPYFLRALGDNPQVSVCNRTHYIDAETDWATFLRGISKSRRTNINQYTRRLFESYKCEFRSVETEDELEPAMDALVRLHQARWQSRGEPGSFTIIGFEEFLKQAMRASLVEGRLRLWVLELDGQIAAVRLAFFDNGIVHGFQAGFDPAHSKESVGTVMLGLCLRACIEDGQVREYDFMGGNDAHKDSWSKTGRENVSLTWLRPGLRSRIYGGIERTKRIGKSLLKATIPLVIRQELHRLIIKRHYSNPG